MEDRSDSIVFFTLIDFLVQLLFFLVVAVVLYNTQTQAIDRHATILKLKSNPNYVPLLDGLGPFIKAENIKLLQELFKSVKNDNELQRLVAALKTMNPSAMEKLADTIAKAGEDPNSPVVTTMVQRALTGIGQKSCLENGSRESLFSITAFDDRLVVTEIFPHGVLEFEKLGVRLNTGDVIPRSEIESRLKPFKKKDQNCVYFVRYIRKTDSESIRRLVERSLILSNPVGE